MGAMAASLWKSSQSFSEGKAGIGVAPQCKGRAFRGYAEA